MATFRTQQLKRNEIMRNNTDSKFVGSNMFGHRIRGLIPRVPVMGFDVVIRKPLCLLNKLRN